VFTEPPAQYEAKALEAYYALCLELKDAFPASFNSLESIWDAIKSVASNIWDVAKPAVQEVAQKVIPMMVSRGGEMLMGGLTGARRGKITGTPRVTYRAPSVSTVRSLRSVRAKTPVKTLRKRVKSRK